MVEQNIGENITNILADGARFIIVWFEIFVLLTLLVIAGYVTYQTIIYYLYKKEEYEKSHKETKRKINKTNE